MQNIYNNFCKMNVEDLRKAAAVAELILKFREEVGDENLTLKISQRQNHIMTNPQPQQIPITPQTQPQRQPKPIDGSELEQGRAKPIFMYDANWNLVRKFETFSQTSKWLRDNGTRNSSNKLRKALAEGRQILNYYFKLDEIAQIS